MKNKNNTYSIFMTVSFCLILLGFGLGIFILPDSDFSENENRVLQSAPKISLDSVVSGEYMKDIADYYSDQFPLREQFVSLKAGIELALNKKQNESVVFADDSYLAVRADVYDETVLQKNIDGLVAFSKGAKEIGVDTVFALAPRTVDVLGDKLPEYFPSDRQAKVIGKIDLYAEDVENYINLTCEFKERLGSGEEGLFYKTDHHWTVRGAYIAYNMLGDTLGYEPYSEDYFNFETVSDAFYGTTWSSSGAYWHGPDIMEFARFSNDEDYVTEIIDTGVKLDGFYDLEKLGTKDKYSSFIGGNNAHVRITNPSFGEREKLLVIKDSFAHSLVPFLALHYDLEIIDLRYTNDSMIEFVKENNISKVLVLYNVASMYDAVTLGLLALGI